MDHRLWTIDYRLMFFPFLCSLVRPDNGLYQAVPYYIFFIQLQVADAIDIPEDPGGFFQAGSLVLRQVYLCKVAGDDRFGR
jgi:hypothetical protein